ncbi:glycosyltransferase [Sphingomonas montanisoli]|uniref:Glycosyltransferase family 4 protein n=1 Tax=Sphingomonas montanisoli TaxID=2606412 RepID=A0A5D9C2E6_9SPHN|nr:glycosyltransferase [Sphingomonas montanisoli]TZG25140.1 glycosyltransferase family 4 protein [Sphingomonas montanisoli]
MGDRTLKVLTLSTLFPDATRPTFGVFVERQTVGLAARDNVEVKVVAPIGLPPAPLQGESHKALAALPLRENWKGLEVYRPRFTALPIVGGAINPWMMRRAIAPLLTEIRRDFAFDVIDAEFFYPDGPAAVALGQRFGVPVSIKARGADISYWGRRRGCGGQVLAAGRAAAGMLAVSGALRDEMIALGMPEDRIRVHHTGVDQRAFRPMDRAAAKAALGVSGPFVVTIGHLIPRKSQSLTIAAMAQVPDATCWVVGQGPDEAKLRGEIAALGLQDRVHLIGPKPHEALPGILAAADVMALPSASEGLANVWVEALACGTPIVVGDIGGADEVVDRPAAGRIVARETGAVAAAIRALIADPPAQTDVAEAARRFTWERNGEVLEAHLRGLVALP